MHAFLYAGRAGWRLAPAYDLNPVPADVKPRMLSTTIGLDEDRTASLDLAFEVAEYFDLSTEEAEEIVREVARATERWRATAAALGLPARQIERLSTAFEHEDMDRARSL